MTIYKHDDDAFKQFIKNTKNMINHKETRDKDMDDMGQLESIGRMSKTECKENGNRFRKYRCDVTKNNDSTCGMNTNFRCQKGSSIGTQLCMISDTGRCKLTTEAAKSGLRKYNQHGVCEATKTLRQQYLNTRS